MATDFDSVGAPSPPESTHRCRTTRSRSTPFATSVSPSQSWSRTIATSRRTPPSSSSWSTTPSTRSWIPSQPSRPRRACTIARSSTGRSTPRWRRPTSSCGRRSTSPRFTCLPVECYAGGGGLGRVRRPPHGLVELPGAVHAPRRCRRSALRLRGDRLRLITPPDSGGSFGIKSSVFGYVVLARARVPQARRSREMDQGPARASRRERSLDRARWTESRRAFTATGELIDAALRRDRGRRRIRARTGARDVVSHARLALGCLPGAQRGRAQPRGAHEHDTRQG